jgi:SAM-dependent methyltransferase
MEGKDLEPDGYLLDNAGIAAGERLNALSALYDPGTFRHFIDLGVAAGWRCWEVGAGGPSVPRWLAQRVGPEGRVLEVLCHDIALDAPPTEAFDLVHARLVLIHVMERDLALRSMVRSLRPGGWLLIEDADPGLQPLSTIDPRTPEEALANSLRTGFRTLMARRGVDLEYGRKLPRLLRSAGLTDVRADAWFPVAMPECANLETATIHMIRDRLVTNGIATPEEIERHLENVAAGVLDLAQPPMISAWARRSWPS